MADNDDGGSAKRQRTVRPTAHDILLAGRKLWLRDTQNPYVASTTQQEDRKFREWFGCGPLVALATWNMLLVQELLPADGTLEHFLWTLMFMKQYQKTELMCRLCGGIDPKTLEKWVWAFIDAISCLESFVVSLH